MEFTFEHFDKLNRKPLADRLTKAISSFYPFTDGAYVLSLNAKFGSGKTTFLKMWHNELEKQGHSVIYLNAWETDFDEDPIIPLTSCLLDIIGNDIDDLYTKNALMKVIGAGALIGNKFIEQATGINIHETIKDTDSTFKENSFKEIGEEIYNSYMYKLRSYRNLDKLLSNYINGLDHKPMFIFVDELDRVRPNYSVRFLEAIKHIFSVRGICFVLAVDRHQLECSVKQLYGGLDFDNYYLRFITREIDLVQKLEYDKSDYVRHVASSYFDKEKKETDFCFDDQQKIGIIQCITNVCNIFDFTPRQVHYLFRIVYHLLLVEKSDRKIMENWINAFIILIGIMIHNNNLYKKIGSGESKASDLYTYFSSFRNNSNYDHQYRYIMYTALAYNLRSGDEDNDTQTAEVITKYENMKITEEDRLKTYRQHVSYLSKYVNTWGRLGEKSGFQDIYSKVEEWKPFIE